jgi:hypothetical protein
MRARQLSQDKEKQIMNTSDSYSGDNDRDVYQASGSGVDTPGYNAADSGAAGQATGGNSYTGGTDYSQSGTDFGQSGTGYGQSGTYRSTEEIKAQAQAKTGEVIDQAKEKTSQVVGQVQERAKSQLATQKDRAAEGLGSMAMALRQASRQLQDQNNAPVAQVTNTAAEQIEKVSTFLRERDLNEMVTEVERFARRQPAIFLGGALVLGLIGARFLKSSGQRAMELDRYDSTRGRVDYYTSQAYRGGYGSDYGSSYGATGTTGASGLGDGQSYETQVIPTYSPDLEG